MATTPAPLAAPSQLTHYLSVAVPARLADEGARIGLVLLALQRTHSASLGGALVAALMIPHVVAAPVLGALADRVRRRKLFHASCLLTYGLGLAATALTVGRLPAGYALALVAATGCAAPLVTGGLTSLLGELVPPDRLSRAFSIDSTSYNLAGICGPAVAAALSAAAGPASALVVLGAAGVFAAGAMATLRLAPRPGTRERSARLRPADLATGALELLKNPPLRAVTWASSAGQIGIGALPVLTALLAKQYDAGWAAGGLMTAFAAGALAGSLIYAVRPWTETHPERVVLACLLTTGPPLALAAVRPSLALTALLFALSGVCTGPLFSALLAARERYAPTAVRTQIFTLGAGLKSTAAAGGAAVAGALGGLGTSTLLLAAAACQLLATGLGAALLATRRDARVSRASEDFRADESSGSRRARTAAPRTTESRNTTEPRTPWENGT
ncbi:MFS transporter [Streptomyces sp. AM 4-1-1]|uniref:MFS transporter n=1 Tax=Streptomyces sp. AM 4-1-1 TaxID=3028710 RepID=UPI0023BA145D|nr:MFS transporter [Streptomyces sp. AM 4-1-1]WEH37238.1 MFS transporter [Streptomyces sp. AM 4-1-1]